LPCCWLAAAKNGQIVLLPGHIGLLQFFASSSLLIQACVWSFILWRTLSKMAWGPGGIEFQDARELLPSEARNFGYNAGMTII
jgi:hypothetical protein